MSRIGAVPMGSLAVVRYLYDIDLASNPPQLQFLTWCLFVAATSLHIFCNYLAVRSLVMTQCNGRRAGVVAAQYLSNQDVLSPSQANSREPLFSGELGLELEQLCHVTPYS
jgi:hypothetical protein